MSDLSELIELMFSRTQEGKLNWHMDGERRATVKQGDSIVDIDRLMPAGLLPAGFRLTVRNTDGIILATTQVSLEASEHKKLSDIFDRARRDALGVDKALDALKSSLLQL